MKPALQPAQTITTSLTLAETTSMGVGAMVGAGIFALLGHAGSIAGSVVYISFILAGGISRRHRRYGNFQCDRNPGKPA